MLLQLGGETQQATKCSLQGAGAKAPLTNVRSPDLGLRSPHNQAGSEMLPERHQDRDVTEPHGCSQPGPGQAIKNSNTEKIQNMKFKIGINSKIRERRSKRILIFPMMNFFSGFFVLFCFCEISNANLREAWLSYPSSTFWCIPNVPNLAWLSLPGVTQHRFRPHFPSNGQCMIVRSATRYRGIPTPKGLPPCFCHKGKQFWLLSIVPQAVTPPGQVPRAMPAAQGDPHTCPQGTHRGPGLTAAVGSPSPEGPWK